MHTNDKCLRRRSLVVDQDSSIINGTHTNAHICACLNLSEIDSIDNIVFHNIKKTAAHLLHSLP